MKRALLVPLVLISFLALNAQNPEPSEWYAGDMHVHRSCGASPVPIASIYQKMDTENLAVVSLLADMGNGEVQTPATDLPSVTGLDDAVSTPGRIVHWDAEWHWDATYSQYAHQALGGHIVALGLREAHQIWDESTHNILQWAHAQNGIAGFAHMQYLGDGIPQTLTCCTPVEYPVEVALGAADFVSEDVSGSDSAIQAYYRLLNSGFRPGFSAGTDYPCNDGSTVGSPLTYVRIPDGTLTYRNWIDGIASGRTVVSRNGHNEFLDLKVNGSAGPGDEIRLSGAGTVQVSVQWTAVQSLSGTIELIWNGTVVSSQQATVNAGSPATLSTAIAFSKSGWLAARRTGSNGHVVHTAAVFVTVDNAPVRANTADPQFYVQWIDYLLAQTSPGGGWNSYFPTSLSDTQARYQSAKALYQQILDEAGGSAATLSSISINPLSSSIAPGSTQQFTAQGTYSNGNAIDISGQVGWTSSNASVASIGPRGLASALSVGSTVISATLGSITGTTPLSVELAPLQITTDSLAGGMVGTAYSATLAASGGASPYAWSLASGSTLPAGFSLSAAGQLSGTPTTAGTNQFSVIVTDSVGTSASKALSITISSLVSTTYTIWNPSVVPSVVDAGADNPVELGVRFKADQNGSVSGVRFYKSAANTGTHTGTLWNSAGAALASVTFSGETDSGWQQANFAVPVAIAAGQAYTVSYHTNVGHYSDDQYYFAAGGVDNAPLHAFRDASNSPNGVFSYGSGNIFPNESWHSSNYWVDVVYALAGADTISPTVVSVSPASGGSGIDTGTPVTVTFSEAMDAASINADTILLFDNSNTAVPASVQYNSSTLTVTLTPTSSLANSSAYTAVVKGGTTDPRVKDVAGNALGSIYTWSFSTASGSSVSPGDGPGGPILIVSSSSYPFSRYYAEILRAEGLNEFAVIDVSAVTAQTLAAYDLVLVGDFPLSSSQVDLLANWVSAGGNLIAMHPETELAGRLGLTDTGTSLSDAYLSIDTSSGPGVGLVADRIQFHGSAERYTVSSATVLAALYSDTSTPAGNPAVALSSMGLGQAAAFSYDLARSVVYTRQGNPAWSGQARDGQSGPIRSDDLFYGAATLDPQTDWVNHSKLGIPQADEQQRLLANLILQMNQRKKPLPRFWYFPKDYKAAVVMTGDDHGTLYGGSGVTAARFNEFLADSPAGCSVEDWTCVRGTAYILAPLVASNALTPAQAQSYVAQGFEVGPHVDSVPTCGNWTSTELESSYASQISSFLNQYSGVPSPRTHRMHCVSWSDYDSQPKTALRHGIRLDTTYYYWPPEWVDNTPGMFTGSGMPMRFADRNGNLLDVYQAATQMTDESGQTYPYHIDTLLDNAVGSAGYYGFFTANMHNDADSAGARAIVASAQARGVPVISARQLLTWLDGRNSSSFGSLAWQGSTLTFTIAVGSGANGLQAMLPSKAVSGGLASIIRDGSAVEYTLKTVKGVGYAVFSAVPGTYQAAYTTAPPVIVAALSISPSSVSGGTSSSGTVTLSTSAPTGGMTVSLVSSNTNAADVPSSVVVPQGATIADFAVSTSAVSDSMAVSITASCGGSSTSAVLTVAPTPTIATLSLSPTSVVGSNSSTGTVALSRAAPTGGVVVALSSSNLAIATVPASVTIAAGSMTASFAVNTSSVASTTSVAIGASTGTTSKTTTLTVTPPVLSSLTLSPSTVKGGASSSGTVTLNAPAPSGGLTVKLRSSSTYAVVPASVIVSAGSRTAGFAVSTKVVFFTRKTTVSASYGGVTKSATLTITR